MNEIKQSAQNNEESGARTIFWGTIALAAITLLVSAYFFKVLLAETRTPVVYFGMAFFLTGIAVMVVSMVLTVRGRQEQAVKLTLVMLNILGLAAIGLFEGRAVTASLTIFVTSVIALRSLFPSQSRRNYTILVAASLILMWTIEWLSPPWRIHVQAASVGPIGAAVFAVLLVVIVVRQTWGSLSLRWKMGSIMAVLFLGMAVITYTGYSGLQSLRYQLSNIYDFMLVPIVAINNANTALADSQIKLDNLDTVGTSALTQNITDIAANNKLASDVIHKYDTDWVTTTSPEFTQALRQAGKLDLQQRELETLKNLHTQFDSYLAVSNQYIQSIKAGKPNHDLAEQAVQSLQASRASLEDLIKVNNDYADFSNRQAQSAHQLAIISGAIALGLALLIGFLISSLIVVSITSRLNELTQFAGAVQQGKLEQRLKVIWNDEISLLGNAFNEMTSQLQESFSTLEQRVAARTRNLELAAEVGRTVSQVRSLDVMLKDACDLILKEFNLYYVQVYLADPSQTTLKLEAGTGTVGAQLVGRGHNLPLNTGSINGRAATEKRSVVISNTTQSATFRQNPLLPDTRGEMAVPLIVANKVVGVLDMQSGRPDVLTEEVLPAFEALAGQLAVAIQNANLLAETEQARAQVETQARRLVRTGWSEHLDAIHKPEQLGFVFDHNQVTPLVDMEESQLPENAQSVSVPISVTGESLGSLVVELDDETQRDRTSELVSVVARQVAQQIENLRLLESAERYRYEAEQASRRLTREGWKSYTEKAGEGLKYIYDLREVRPLNGDTLEAAASVPLKVRDEVVGKFTIQGLDTNDTEGVNLANAVAERLSAHIESLRQQDQTQSALAQSENLFQASSGLTQATDLQELVIAAVKSINIPVVNRALLAVFNYDANGKMDSMNVVANWWNGTGSEATPVGTHYSSQQLRVLSIFTSSTPIFFNDMYNDERIDAPSLEIVKRLNVRAMVGLPLFLGTHQLGTLILEAEEVHNFSQDDVRLFTALAPQIATQLESRRQFERAQQQANRESTLNIISQKIQSATSVEAVLQIAARELGHALGAPMTVAQLSMKDKS